MSKSSKRRACPAVGREITSAECGEKRGSDYACPADCVHNPFAPVNYGQALGVEDAVDRELMDRLALVRRRDPLVDRELSAASAQRSLHALHATTVWHLFFNRGSDGRTVAGQFEHEQFPGCRNDERVLLRAKMQMRMVLMEVRRVLSLERTEVVDLLDPAGLPFVVQDRGLAGVAVRFGVGLTWAFPMPHYWRLSGTALLFPTWDVFEPVTVLRELAQHLGAPADTAGLRLWLSGNFVRFEEALTATGMARHQLMMANADAKFGKAIYELQAPFAECRSVLDAMPAVHADELTRAELNEGFAEARVWFSDEEQPASTVPEGGRPVLGRVLLGQAHWRLEAMGGALLARLRERFATVMAARVKFTGERVDDLGRKLASERPPYDRSLVPPRLLADAPRIVLTTSRIPSPARGASKAEFHAALRQSVDRRFLDEPVPALEGKTPREAVHDPALRPIVIRLMKTRVRSVDEANLRTGRNDDINWLLRELGLTEILFEPPPRRPRPPGERLEEEDLGEDLDDALEAERPEAPPLPTEPLSMEEAQARLEAAMERWDTVEMAEDELEDSGGTLLSDVEELVFELLGEQDFGLLVPFLLQAWFALVPGGVRAPVVPLARLNAALHREMTRLAETTRPGTRDALEQFLAGARQPNLSKLLLAEVLTAAREAPKPMRPKESNVLTMALILRVVVDELDLALRR